MKYYNRIYISNKNKKGSRISKVMTKFHLTKLYCLSIGYPSTYTNPTIYNQIFIFFKSNSIINYLKLYN